MALTASQQAFVNKILPYAQQYGTQYNIDPNLIVSQAALESKWGTSNVATGKNNYFGVTNSGETTGYRTYSNLGDSVAAYASLLGTNGRYKGVIGATGASAADAVASAGYATDPSYASKLKGIMANLGVSAGDPSLTNNPTWDGFWNYAGGGLLPFSLLEKSADAATNMSNGDDPLTATGRAVGGSVDSTVGAGAEGWVGQVKQFITDNAIALILIVGAGALIFTSIGGSMSASIPQATAHVGPVKIKAGF